MPIRTLFAAGLLLAVVTPSLAKPPTDAEKLRQEAEHICYDDVQKLCGDAVPDEDKIKACMKARHAQLSPACAKVYDEGMSGK